MAPIIGPKYGIILVIPTITLIRATNGILKRSNSTAQSIPIIKESINLPTIKPPKILLQLLKVEIK